MNEQDNTNLIQQTYAAFGRGDLQTILSRLTPDVEWKAEGPAVIPSSGTRVGVSEVTEFFKALATTQQNQKLTIDEYIAQGDKVVAIGHYAALVTATGKQFDCPVAHVFTIRDGMITRFLSLTDTARMADAYVAGKAAAA